jgi:SSS family transporter
MNELDIAVLICTIFSISIYGVWRTRHRHDLNSYLKGRGQMPWWAIGLSVMATQASAITFLSTPGQGYLSGLSFVQIYFGVPLALIIISIFFLPIFHKLNVYTAYEYLEKRFDAKTRLLGAVLFLLQRGIGAGLTIYAPAIVLSTVFGWSLQATIICSGLVVTVYTMMGGTDAVTVTQKYQLTIIFLGMITAGILLVAKLPSELSFVDALSLAGGFQKLNAVNFSTDASERYTFWSGLLGGTFLMLSYFGADQSQVQRYISGTSVRESRLGLLFNAIFKIPMQFGILMLGVLMFVFYQFKQPPLFFDTTANRFVQSQRLLSQETPDAINPLLDLEKKFNATHATTRHHLEGWLQAKHDGDFVKAEHEFAAAAATQAQGEKIRAAAAEQLTVNRPVETRPPATAPTKANNADYVFITFILQELPHGAIGLLVTAFFLAALSSKAAELNALGTSTTIDFYRLLIRRDASDKECVLATRIFTAFWGLVAVLIALYAHLSENLIQAVNILGSIFYGVLLALFLVAFFIKRVGGTAIFWSAVVAQILVFFLYRTLSISYLWFPLIGCAACVIFSVIVQTFIGKDQKVIENYGT